MRRYLPIECLVLGNLVEIAQSTEQLDDAEAKAIPAGSGGWLN